MYCGYSCAHAARRVHTPESKAEYHRAYREKNRAWINEKQNAARHGPKREHMLQQSRESYYRNVEKNRERARDYASQHKEKSRARRESWPAQNPERHRFHMTRSNIAQSMGVLPRLVPPDLVEAHMAYLDSRRAVLDAAKEQS
jgi:hypothetical protein